MVLSKVCSIESTYTQDRGQNLYEKMQDVTEKTPKATAIPVTTFFTERQET